MRGEDGEWLAASLDPGERFGALAQEIGGKRGYRYVTFDDATVAAAARADPVGFVDRLPERVILDEVQRVPALFASLKRAIDRERRAGRFILTGSANVLLVPQLSDSLAGRMEIVRLYPLAQCELGWTPRYTLEQGLAETARWFRGGEQ